MHLDFIVSCVSFYLLFLLKSFIRHVFQLMVNLSEVVFMAKHLIEQQPSLLHREEKPPHLLLRDANKQYDGSHLWTAHGGEAV